MICSSAIDLWGDLYILLGRTWRAPCVVSPTCLVPQLNLDEWVWRNVKGQRVGRVGITSLADLPAQVTEALERLAALLQIVRDCFCDPDLRCVAQ